jgi:hypothetical protein
MIIQILNIESNMKLLEIRGIEKTNQFDQYLEYIAN